MLRRVLLPALLLCACKSSSGTKKAPAPADAAPGGGSAASTGPGTGTGTATPPAPDPMVPPAPLPKIADDADCATVADYYGPGFALVADGFKVPADKREGFQTAVKAAFGAACAKTDWPKAVLDCIGKHPTEKFTYERCLARLPAAVRLPWDTELAALVTKFGGEMAAPAKVEAPSGMVFEELCGDFVAEMARFDECSQAGMYVPKLEQVYAARAQVEVGGVIPDEAQPDLLALCEDRARTIKQIVGNMCKGKLGGESTPASP
ncbi:MAG: hypothetical protein H6709_21955 [Kofleriaceae bacterium]|nr:hypothetical protein [Kofleriaceae bacterium]MCB9574750.1 hypothetical protein [Kofleriaceae bacterium]